MTVVIHEPRKWPKRLRLVADDGPSSSEVYDADTGERVPDVFNVRVLVTHATCSLEIVATSHLPMILTINMSPEDFAAHDYVDHDGIVAELKHYYVKSYTLETM